jgi:hypothetical protein
MNIGGFTLLCAPLLSKLGLAPSAEVKVRDLWQKKDVGIFSGNYTAKALGPHASQMLKLFTAK